MSSRHSRITQILQQNLNPVHIELEDESHMHGGDHLESHFKLLVVSDSFRGLSRIDRQRRLNELIKEEFQQGLHALTQRALDPDEWARQQSLPEFQSPDCLGGSSRDKKS